MVISRGASKKLEDGCRAAVDSLQAALEANGLCTLAPRHTCDVAATEISRWLRRIALQLCSCRVELLLEGALCQCPATPKRCRSELQPRQERPEHTRMQVDGYWAGSVSSHCTRFLHKAAIRHKQQSS